MTHEEKQLEAIALAIKAYEEFTQTEVNVGLLSESIAKAIRELEPERLEVEIAVNPSGEGGYGLEFPCMFEEDFNTRQEAIDFCKKYNLKIRE